MSMPVDSPKPEILFTTVVGGIALDRYTYRDGVERGKIYVITEEKFPIRGHDPIIDQKFWISGFGPIKEMEELLESIRCMTDEEVKTWFIGLDREKLVREYMRHLFPEPEPEPKKYMTLEDLRSGPGLK